MRRHRPVALFSMLGLLLGGAAGLATAASLSGGTLVLSPGDSVTASCPNSLSTSNRSTHGITLHCAANITPPPTTTTISPTTTAPPTTTVPPTTTTPPVTTTPPTTTTQPNGTWWQPGAGNIEWQWEIDHPLSLSSAADMGTGKTAYNGATAPATNPTVYDIDGFDNPASTVSSLHASGFKVICYIEVGAAENYRADYSQFPASALGNVMSGYSSERYVDIRNATVVSIIEARISMCGSKGFDAVETDIDESYQSNTGFPLTKANEETFMATLSDFMHTHGMGWVAKNLDDTGDSYAQDMYTHADALLTEECNAYGTCGLFPSYLGHKAVLNAEYTSDNQTTAKFCPADNAAGINGVLFNVNLNGSLRSPCR